MASRRGENRIRGPHSALTDFLAANNISARQIRDDYQRRLQEVADEDGDQQNENGQEEEEEVDLEAAEAAIQRNRRRLRNQDEAISQAKKDRKMKNAKKDMGKKNKGKSKKRKSKDSEDEEDEDEDEDDSDFDLGKKMYTKAKKLPGQFSNCEICEKRFTVTPYSKTGPEGGLLCSPCGKEIEKDVKSTGKKPVPKPNGATKRRRQAESERMDGVVRRGAKPLLQHCIEMVAKHHEDIESLENVPEHVMGQICRLFSKERAINSTTLPLFYSPELSQLKVYDCAKLKFEDFSRIFAELPKLKSLSLENAAQFKDANVDYMMEKAIFIKHLKLYGANLISNDKWSELWRARGFNLETIQLRWLDASFTDQQVVDMARFCPNLKRLKLENCWHLGPDAVDSIADMKSLEHLSLCFIKSVPNEHFINLITSIGPNLKTLSLRSFKDIDDSVLATIHEHCHQLRKLRIADNDTTTDAGWADLFLEWDNPPLEYVDVSGVRDIDNQKPDGPEDGNMVGMAEKGFPAMMAHSGETLRHLDISSCRHIPLATLMDVFSLGASFPEIVSVDFSFVQHVDDVVLAGLFKASKASLKKVALFGCFGITSDCLVPKGVVVIGAPRVNNEEDGMEIWGNNDMDAEAVERQHALDAQLQEDIEMTWD